MRNTFIYLIGHYGVGKLTIARAICAATGARLFDNHLVNNVVFSLIRVDGKTPLPQQVWGMIDAIRDQALLAIEQLTPTEASFVLTNCLIEGDPMDRAAYERVECLSRRRGGVFVPVVLQASDAAHAERIPRPERAERLKHTDVDSAADMRRATELLRVDHSARLDLDTTDLPPNVAAARIITHARSLAP